MSIERLEQNLVYVNEQLELVALVEKLQRNPTFKKVIVQGYFKDEAVRQVSLLSDPAMQDPDRQLLITNAMRGIGELQSWLDSFRMREEQLKKRKYDIEQELEYRANNPTEDDSE